MRFPAWKPPALRAPRLPAPAGRRPLNPEVPTVAFDLTEGAWDRRHRRRRNRRLLAAAVLVAAAVPAAVRWSVQTELRAVRSDITATRERLAALQTRATELGVTVTADTGELRDLLVAVAAVTATEPDWARWISDLLPVIRDPRVTVTQVTVNGDLTGSGQVPPTMTITGTVADIPTLLDWQQSVANLPWTVSVDSTYSGGEGQLNFTLTAQLSGLPGPNTPRVRALLAALDRAGTPGGAPGGAPAGTGTDPAPGTDDPTGGAP